MRPRAQPAGALRGLHARAHARTFPEGRGERPRPHGARTGLHVRRPMTCSRAARECARGANNRRPKEA